MEVTPVFLHGLDSSSMGTKGRWFHKHFPDMVLPDFSGSLDQRLMQLESVCRNRNNLVLVGSSFGGLMAACFAIAHPRQCNRLILLAPALNFPEYVPPEEKTSIPVRLIIGEHDTVTPPDKVLPLARQTFSNLAISCVDDDHLLHKTFFSLNWREMLHS